VGKPEIGGAEEGKSVFVLDSSTFLNLSHSLIYLISSSPRLLCMVALTDAEDGGGSGVDDIDR